MEIVLTLEQEAQLCHLADLEDKAADLLAREILLRGLQVEAGLLASRSRSKEGQETAVRLLQLRRENMLPEGVSVEALIREGRA